MNNAQIGDKILAYDNEQTAAINANKDKITTVEQSVTDLDAKLSKDYIVDYGSNENGNWEKWASGKLVQWGVLNLGRQELTRSVSGTFTWVDKTAMDFSFPISFLNSNQSDLTIITDVSSYGFTSSSGQYKSDSQFSVRLWETSSSSVNRIYVSWESAGYWK